MFSRYPVAKVAAIESLLSRIYSPPKPTHINTHHATPHTQHPIPTLCTMVRTNVPPSSTAHHAPTAISPHIDHCCSYTINTIIVFFNKSIGTIGTRDKTDTYCPKNLLWCRYPDPPATVLEDDVRSISAKKAATASYDLWRRTLGSRKSDHNSS